MKEGGKKEGNREERREEKRQTGTIRQLTSLKQGKKGGRKREGEVLQRRD